MSSKIYHYLQQEQQSSSYFEGIHSLTAVITRLYIGQVFFMAGLTKIGDWDTTLFLFEEEYNVPFLNYELAAWLGTTGELILPVLLIAGLVTRFTAIGLFVVNLVAVISLTEIAPAALYLHIIWGILLTQLIIYGEGKLTIDRLIAKLARSRKQ
ncbi:DoxX family protein [Oceanospirillum sediminis]|uniref:DoxX family protein n=1 Tax=Oceanospirillum sediminis TaxID=2760088 RepID=A0A839INN8_9GAMM|nr:DoxX family protein [Oceanospirillum sediminis]MBB1486087.1 DoxX family protein [Oceanospirillum sediminis]